MKSPLTLSTPTATIIYLILVSGVIAIIIAYKMMPKEARIISLELIGKYDAISFSNDPPDSPLRYKLDDEYVRIYANGKLYIFPIASILSLEIDP